MSNKRVKCHWCGEEIPVDMWAGVLSIDGKEVRVCTRPLCLVETAGHTPLNPTNNDRNKRVLNE